MMVTVSLKDSAQSFKILDLTKFSDHKTDITKMKLRNTFQDADKLFENLKDVPVRHKWNNEDESTHYHSLAIQNLSEYRERVFKISQRLRDTKEEVECLNQSLVQVYPDMAEKLTGRESLPNSHRL